MITFYINKWSAWAPGASNLEEWQRWAEVPYALTGTESPTISFIPPMLRRRTGQLTRMALEVALRCLNTDERSKINSIFGTRHGESKNTQSLLETLAAQDPISPMTFSLSVYNSTAGLFSICTGNRNQNTTISAGKKTFCYSLLEALTRLYAQQDDSILIVVGDEAVPAAFREAVEEMEAVYAFAALLSLTPKNNNDPIFNLDIKPSTSSSADPFMLPQALSFIKFLFSQRSQLTFTDERLQWLITKNCNSSAERYAT